METPKKISLYDIIGTLLVILAVLSPIILVILFEKKTT